MKKMDPTSPNKLDRTSRPKFIVMQALATRRCEFFGGQKYNVTPERGE